MTRTHRPLRELVPSRSGSAGVAGHERGTPRVRTSIVTADVTAELPLLRPRDRAMYLAALAVGLAEAGIRDDAAVATLAEACDGRRGDAQAARRRLFSSHLGSSEHRREAARLLDLLGTRLTLRRRSA